MRLSFMVYSPAKVSRNAFGVGWGVARTHQDARRWPARVITSASVLGRYPSVLPHSVLPHVIGCAPSVFIGDMERHGPDRKRRGAAGREVTILATDQTLRCRECGRDFVFTVGEQEFYASKGLLNTPSRCPECRAARKAGMSGGYGQDRAPRQMYTATCSSCGGEARVPFQPRGDKPVYCSNCFQQISGGARSSYGS